ncbi:MAG: F0F1 ATP synthase subunit A [Candidatus Melainabacteria bacterium]|jgi:F-type H+-transporting ATPase subunit a
MTDHSSAAPHIQSKLLGLTINLDTLFFSWAVMILILLSAVLFASSLKKQNVGVGQFIFESIHDLWEGQISSQINWNPNTFVSFISSIFTFILIAYWIGLFPWKLGLFYSWWPHLDNGHPWEGSSVTSDLNITAGFAVISTLGYVLAGIASGGFSYIAPYFGLGYHHGKISFNPVGLIEWLDLILRPLTLSLRLFANTFAGEALTVALVKLVPFLLPVLILGFEFCIGILQAFIFSMLTTVYIAIAVSHAPSPEDKHHEGAHATAH